MPGGDRTGPRGTGQMTGRGAGYCTGFGSPGFVNQDVSFRDGFGRGSGGGFGRGGGRGFRNGGGRGRGWQSMNPGYGQPVRAQQPFAEQPAQNAEPYEGESVEKQEMAYLKVQARRAKKALDDIESRIAELEGRTQKESE